MKDERLPNRAEIYCRRRLQKTRATTAAKMGGLSGDRPKRFRVRRKVQGKMGRTSIKYHTLLQKCVPLNP